MVPIRTYELQSYSYSPKPQRKKSINLTLFLIFNMQYQLAEDEYRAGAEDDPDPRGHVERLAVKHGIAELDEGNLTQEDIVCPFSKDKFSN